MNNKISSAFLFIFITSYFSIGCHSNTEDISKQIILKSPVSTMTSEEFAKKLAEKLSKYDSILAKDPAQIDRSKKEVEKDFIIQAVVKGFAQNEKITVSKEEVDQEINKMRSSFPDDYAFRQELSKQGVSYYQLQTDMNYHTLEKKVFKFLSSKIAKPTDEEIQKYYDSNKSKYQFKERIFLRQIVLSNESDADKIQNAIKEKKSFEKLAKNFSIAPEGKDKGGLVGWVEKGTLEIFDKAFELAVNIPSKTFESPYGFHIFLVEKKSPAGYQSLAEVKEKITRQLAEKKEQTLFSEWLDREVKQLHIFKDSKLIQVMSVETREKE